MRTLKAHPLSALVCVLTNRALTHPTEDVGAESASRLPRWASTPKISTTAMPPTTR